MAFHLLVVLYALVASSLAAKVSTIYQFPPGHWAENLTTRRSDGHIFAVLFSHPQVWRIDPYTSPPTASLAASFEGKSGIQGIVETSEDGVFAVMPFQGSEYSLWTIDSIDNTTTEVIDKIEGVGTLNGLTRIPNTNILLASDTKMGAIVQLDLESKSSSIVIQDSTMVGVPFVGAGINGVRATAANVVYYTNFFSGALYRVPVDPITASATGPIQQVASGLGILDDLAVDETTEDAFVMQYFAGTVARVKPNGSWEVIAKGLNRPTSAVLGNKERRKVLCVSCSGNSLGVAPIFKGWFEGGGIYAIELD